MIARLRGHILELRRGKGTDGPGMVRRFGQHLQVAEVVLQVAAGGYLVLDVDRASIILCGQRLGESRNREKSRRGVPEGNHRANLTGGLSTSDRARPRAGKASCPSRTAVLNLANSRSH